VSDCDGRCDVTGHVKGGKVKNSEVEECGKSRENPETGESRHSSNSVARGVKVAGLMVAFLAIAGLAVMKTTSAGATDGSGPAVSDVPSADVLRAVQAELEANVASGWVPMDEKHPYAGEPVQGWVPMGSDSSSLLAAYQKVEGRLPVFAQKGGGSVIGYLYQYIGFVPVDLADGGTFDAHAVRSERVGCDPILPDGSIDAKCNSLFMESMGS